MLDSLHLAALVGQEQWAFNNRHRNGVRILKDKLNDLTPQMRGMAVSHRAACASAGIELLIYCTLRSNEAQAALYAIGRTLPGVKKTKARPGQSAHNPDKNGKASAYDCVPLVGGKAVWTTSSKEDAALWAKVGSLGEVAGLSWSGRWRGDLREMAHFADPAWVKPF